MENEHLVPDLIKDIITKYKESKKNHRNVNEYLSIHARLEAIRTTIDKALMESAGDLRIRKRQ